MTLGYAIAATTVVLQSAAHVVGVSVLDDRIWNLNADVEFNAVAWAGSAATFAAALAAFALALVPADVDRRLLALSFLLAAFSLDDAIGIHERLALRGADALGLSPDAGRAIWPVVYLPLLAAGLLLLLDTARRVFEGAGRLLRHGVALLVLALAAEFVAAFLGTVLDVQRGAWPDVAEVTIEEGAEIGGWLLISFGLAAALVMRASAEERA